MYELDANPLPIVILPNEKQLLLVNLAELLEGHNGFGLEGAVRARIWELWVQVFKKCVAVQCVIALL
jgi:hypothetical protein